MNRRGFLAGAVTTAAGLLLPYEPKVIYSFAKPKVRRNPKNIEVVLDGRILEDHEYKVWNAFMGIQGVWVEPGVFDGDDREYLHKIEVRLVKPTVVHALSAVRFPREMMEPHATA